MSGGFIAFGIFVVLAGMLSKSMVQIVPGKTAFIIETFGKPWNTALTPGLSFILPWPVHAVVGKVSAIKKAAPKLSDADIMTFLADTNRLDTIRSAAMHGNMIVVDMQDTASARTIALTGVGVKGVSK